MTGEKRHREHHEVCHGAGGFDGFCHRPDEQPDREEREGADDDDRKGHPPGPTRPQAKEPDTNRGSVDRLGLADAQRSDRKCDPYRRVEVSAERRGCVASTRAVDLSLSPTRSSIASTRAAAVP